MNLDLNTLTFAELCDLQLAELCILTLFGEFALQYRNRWNVGALRRCYQLMGRQLG